MQTENLNQMINADVEQQMEWIDPDYMTLNTDDYPDDESQSFPQV